MKKCYICEKLKQPHNFYKCSKSKDGLGHYCKPCHYIKKKEKTRTKKGFIRELYSHQLHSSKTREHTPPTYSREDLQDWLFSQKKFHHLFHLWELSNYDTYLRPSTYRIDDFSPYSFSNIQLMTWGENTAKGHLDRSMGVGTQGKANCKTVYQYDLNGNFIAEYFSAVEAGRITGACAKHIPTVCKGKRKQTGGFIWRNEFIKEGQAVCRKHGRK